MKLYMLDTDIASYIIRGTSQNLLKKFSRNVSAACISTITMAELQFGAQKKNSEQLTVKVNAFCELVTIKDWTEETALIYGKLRASLENAGTPLDSIDLLIAASALAENAVLITNNTEHFSKVPRLKLENWLDT